ncbi:uncharacterized protein LOC131624172 [Vicia villosa]|uniref:uncharacterized protein LOC131624172 n=1 Tax=Vicia villosa TaxID=3911 RepID=UPI00273CC39A|nr:uncharacterized protein LOC131624172 [Vicia villosa]
MSRKFSSLKDINDSKETWRLVIRVVDLWSVINNKGKEHLEMVIMDAMGDRIQVLIRADHTPKWKERIRENISCIVNNGNVYDNDFQWKLCDHDKKFVFIGGMTLKEVDIQNLPPKRFYFKDFSDILAGKCQLNRLEDIIGVVQEINNFQYNNSGKKSFVSLNVKDLKGNILNCTLWESYRINFLDFYHNEKNSGAISGSKLLINEDIPEITEFLSKLPVNEQPEKPSQSSKGMSLWSGASQFTPIESFVHKAKCISLSELCKVKQDMLCVTVGTTQKFFVSKHGWFYYGCTKCSLKASDVNNPYKCSCGQNVEHAILSFDAMHFSKWYRVDIYVIDGESKFRFVFWDTDCADIIGKSADSIYKAMLEEGDDDPMIYLDELDMLLGKKMAFRAKVQPTFGQASGDIIPLTQNPIVDRVDDSIEFLSAYGENDTDKVVTNTPSKGSPITLDVEDSECQPYGATQLSRMKPSKK